MPDRTDELRDLHEAAVKAMPSEELAAARKALLKRRPRKPPTDPFGEPRAALEKDCWRAISDARAAVATAFAATDDPRSSASDIARAGDSLTASDAELLAVASRVKAFQSAVRTSEEKLAARTRHNEGRELLEHNYNAAAVLADAAGRQRVGVALAREELQRHRGMLVGFEKSGVLVTPGAAQAPAAGGAVATSATAKSTEALRKKSVLAGGLGAVRGVASAAGAAEVTKRAAQGVRVAADSASSTVVSLGTNAFKLASSRLAGGAAQGAKPQAKQADKWGAAFAEDLPEARRNELKQEHEALLVQQRQSSAQAAKEVEAAVHEVSVMNAIMAEQVSLQAEQLALVERDTDASHANLNAAAGQLRKPIAARWNAKRTLAATLYGCSALLLIANWALR